MLRLAARLLATALLVTPALAPAFAEEIQLPTATGPVAVAAQPAKVAVLDIAAIDTLTALGVTPAGTPDKLYVPYLADLAGKALPVGTLFEPDLEALAALAPDLIIAGGRSSTQVEPLSAVAPTVDMTIWEDIPAEGRARIEAYGNLFGKQAEAARLTAAWDAKFTEAKAAIAGKGRALIVMTNGPKIAAYGKGSRFGWLHSALDLPEARENLDPETHGDAISFEFIAEVNPDWLIVVDRASAIGEAGSAQATLDNALVKGTTAGQKGQIIYLDAAPIYIAGGGFRSMMGTLDQLIAAFGA